jgi:NAD dependent epimerase/dehydratase family enzyme
MVGVFNATGPNPVTNVEFMRELRRALHRPWSPPAPVWAVKLGSRWMETEPSLALTGRRCRPARFLRLGFKFQFPELRGALKDIYR